MSSEIKNSNWLFMLRRWLKGDATYGDEKAMDKLAKEDAFLADALEGFRSAPEGDHSASIARLRVRLQQGVRRKNRGLVYYAIRAAAIGAVLIAAWMVFDTLNENGNEATISLMEAETKQRPVAPAPEAQNSLAEATEVKPESDTPDLAPEPAKKKREPIKPEGNELAISTKPLPAQIVQPVSSERQVEQELAIIEAQDKKVAEQVIAYEPAKQQATERYIKPADKRAAPKALMMDNQAGAARARVITGKVTNQSGEPLVGAMVLLKDSQKGTVTDQNGNFKVEVVDPTAISVSYLGYQNWEVQVGELSQYHITLPESPVELSEVAVSQMKDDKGKPKKENIRNPEPENGFLKFEKYLAESLRYPTDAAKNNIRGIVRVRFRVEPDGSLKELTVLDSLGYGCDEEAVRLLAEGPKWKPSGMATYSIPFKK